MKPQWSPETRRWVVLGLIVVALITLYAIRDTLSTVVLALLAAYLLNPLVVAIKSRWRFSRLAATALIYLVFIVVLAATFGTLAPMLFRQLGDIELGFDKMFAQIESGLVQLPLLSALGVSVDWMALGDQLRSEAAELARNAPRVLIGAASGVLRLFLILVLSFYLLKDAEEIERNLDNAIPEHYRDEWRQAKEELAKIWSSFLRGQILLAMIIGVTTTITLAILGVPNALLLGFLAGLLEVVPNLGPILAAIPAVLIAFFQGSANWPIENATFAVIVIVAYLLIQQLENHLIVPNVLGASVKLPPIVILFGAFAGATIAGVLGIFLAAPVLATTRLALRFVFRRLLE